MDAQRTAEQDTTEADIAVLVDRARNGDHAATWELLQRYRPLLARTVRRSYLAHGDCFRLWDRDDLWQEARCAFLIALQRYDRARRVPFGGYVKSSLPWHFRGLQRQVRADATVSLDEAQAAALPDPDDDFVIGIIARDLLASLTPLQARVLEAIYVDDLPAEQIARGLGVTTRAVERTRRRAEVALSDLLTVDEGARLRLLK